MLRLARERTSRISSGDHRLPVLRKDFGSFSPAASLSLGVIPIGSNIFLPEDVRVCGFEGSPCPFEEDVFLEDVVL